MESQNPVFKAKIYTVILVIIMATQIIPIDVGWGYLEVYIASYLYSFSDSITTSKVHMLVSVLEIGQMLGAQIFHLVISWLGYREGITLALLLMATGMLICSISTTIWGFIIPAVLFGIAEALRCLICSFYMVELMPESYALAAGLGNGGSPFALLFWSWIPLQVVNPNNASPDKEIIEVTRTAYYFGEAVISRVPYLFQVLMMISIVASFQPLVFIKNPPWLYSLVDKAIFGRVQRTELSPIISIRASPARKPKPPVSIELIACNSIPDLEKTHTLIAIEPIALAGTRDLEKIVISDRNDSKNSRKGSGSKNSRKGSGSKNSRKGSGCNTPLQAEQLIPEDDLLQTEAEIDRQYKIAQSSLQFAMLFLTQSFSISSLIIFMLNVKNFGLRYYSDQAITKTSLVAMPAFFVTRVCIGAIVDKFGMLFVYRIVTAVTILTVIAFFMFMDIEWVFYLCVMLIFGLYGSIRTMHTISTSFIYDHEVGKRLQKYMHCAAVIAGMAAVLIHDNIVLQIFGQEAQVIQIVGVNLVIFLNLHRFDWIR